MNKKQTLIIGSITYGMLLILSVYFYKERTVFTDMAFHIFSIVKDHTFAIQNYRFGAFITQLFPIIGLKLGASLSNIAIAYSLSFVLLYFATFIIITHFLNNIKIGLCFLLFSILITTHTFFWIQSELPQGAAFLFVFIAILDNALKKDTVPIYFNFASAFCLFVVSFTHPLLLFACLFLFIFLYFTYPQKRQFIAFIFLSYFSFYVIKAVFFKTSYDEQAMAGLKNIYQLFPYYFNIQSNKNLVHYFWHDYYFLIILLIVEFIFYIKYKLFFKIALIFTFFVGYTFMINMSYPDGASQYYLENQYLLLAIFIGTPFVYDILPSIKSKNWQLAVIFTIALLGIIRIYTANDIYTRQLIYYRKLLSETAQLPQKKLILSADKITDNVLPMPWASSYELWLLSTIEQGVSRSLIIEDTPHEFDWTMNNNKSFITKWGIFDYAKLNPKYFNFTDTSLYVRQ